MLRGLGFDRFTPEALTTESRANLGCNEDVPPMRMVRPSVSLIEVFNQGLNPAAFPLERFANAIDDDNGIVELNDP